MKAVIFYSWQSDTTVAANRTLIQDALEAAVNELRADGSLEVEPVVDRDTLGVPGSPDIGETILAKIDRSAAVVADVTIINQEARDRQRLTPNPNVMIEVGYALKSRGPKRLILVLNSAFGKPEDLPFDLRQKRVLTYCSPAKAPSRAEDRRSLEKHLKEALRLAIAEGLTQAAAGYPVRLTLEYKKKKITGARHDYVLLVDLANEGTKTIKEWHVDVTIPTRLLENPASLAPRIPERSDDKRTLLRASQNSHRIRGPIEPGDTRRVIEIDYRVDNEIYNDDSGWLFLEKVTAIAYVHDTEGAKAERTVREIQCF